MRSIFHQFFGICSVFFVMQIKFWFFRYYYMHSCLTMKNFHQKISFQKCSKNHSKVRFFASHVFGTVFWYFGVFFDFHERCFPFLRILVFIKTLFWRARCMYIQIMQFISISCFFLLSDFLIVEHEGKIINAFFSMHFWMFFRTNDYSCYF